MWGGGGDGARVRVKGELTATCGGPIARLHERMRPRHRWWSSTAGDERGQGAVALLGEPRSAGAGAGAPYIADLLVERQQACTCTARRERRCKRRERSSSGELDEGGSPSLCSLSAECACSTTALMRPVQLQGAPGRLLAGEVEGHVGPSQLAPATTSSKASGELALVAQCLLSRLRAKKVQGKCRCSWK